MNKNTYLPESRYTFPSREEYCRSFAGILSANDFCTEHPAPYNINRIARSLEHFQRLHKQKLHEIPN